MTIFIFPQRFDFLRAEWKKSEENSKFCAKMKFVLKILSRWISHLSPLYLQFRNLCFAIFFLAGIFSAFPGRIFSDLNPCKRENYRVLQVWKKYWTSKIRMFQMKPTILAGLIWYLKGLLVWKLHSESYDVEWNLFRVYSLWSTWTKWNPLHGNGE